MAAAPPCGGLSTSEGPAGVLATIRYEMAVTPLPDLVLYSRPGCGLCDETRMLLTALLAERAAADRPRPRLLERDIETDPALERAYFASIPVVELGDHRLELVTSLAKLRRLLADVLDP
jgi:hypothetical protein